MKITTFLIAACGVSFTAFAKDVDLRSDYGCDSYDVQVQRLELMSKTMYWTRLKSQGVETEDTNAAQNAASRSMVDLTSRHCKQLFGKYRLLSVKPISGGSVAQIQYFKETTLWVLQ